MSKEQSVVYEPHPVSAERKAELRAQGYKIVDAQFAPEGYEHPDAKPKGKPARGRAESKPEAGEAE